MCEIWFQLADAGEVSLTLLQRIISSFEVRKQRVARNFQRVHHSVEVLHFSWEHVGDHLSPEALQSLLEALPRGLNALQVAAGETGVYEKRRRLRFAHGQGCGQGCLRLGRDGVEAAKRLLFGAPWVQGSSPSPELAPK